MHAQAELDTQAGNKAIGEGTLPGILQQVMDKTKPEATYFGTESGRRTGFFFDLADPSDIPVIAEPAFTSLGAGHIHASHELGRPAERTRAARLTAQRISASG